MPGTLDDAVDAVVVGSGPNGLAAALTLAQAGLSVTVVEGADTPGGGCRTEALTAPGFRHDHCSIAHPLVAASPFFRQAAFDTLRARLRPPEIPFATPLHGDRAVAAFASVEDTAQALGPDRATYRALFSPLVRHGEGLADDVLAPPLRARPTHPVTLARLGAPGLLPASVLARAFRTEEARALLGGVAAHAMAELTTPLTSAFGMLLTVIAHRWGWPVVEGGSQAIADALVAELERRGATVVTGVWVESLDQLPPRRITLLDTSTRTLAALGADALPASYRKALGRFRYGPGICKVDWALDGPVPWAAEVCRRAGTVHIGGSFGEMAASEAEVAAGRHPERPYCIVVQPGVADPTRAPNGRATLWAYCHVPSGSSRDMTDPIEDQIERFAPGFRDLVLARATITAADLETQDPNCVGGDVGSGAATVLQTVFRPVARWNPYRTPAPDLYLCSASTPPGGGVHGMCGVYSARSALHDHFGGPPPFRPDRLRS